MRAYREWKRGWKPSSCWGLELLRGLKKGYEGGWVKGSPVSTPVYWGLFPIHYLPLPRLLSPLSYWCLREVEKWKSLHRSGLRAACLRSVRLPIDL